MLSCECSPQACVALGVACVAPKAEHVLKLDQGLFGLLCSVHALPWSVHFPYGALNTHMQWEMA